MTLVLPLTSYYPLPCGVGNIEDCLSNTDHFDWMISGDDINSMHTRETVHNTDNIKATTKGDEISTAGASTEQPPPLLVLPSAHPIQGPPPLLADDHGPTTTTTRLDNTGTDNKSQSQQHLAHCVSSSLHEFNAKPSCIYQNSPAAASGTTTLQRLEKNSQDQGRVAVQMNHQPSILVHAGMKRKLEYELEDISDYTRPRKISPLFNTPKQRKDFKRRVLRVSVHKLRQIDDPEVFLRRSVLINNTMRRMQQELREEKFRPDCIYDDSVLPNRKRFQSNCEYDFLNNSYLSSSTQILDDIFVQSGCDRLNDSTAETRIHSPGATPSLSNGVRDSCLGDTLNEKQLFSEMDTVFNNLICALTDTEAG